MSSGPFPPGQNPPHTPGEPRRDTPLPSSLGHPSGLSGRPPSDELIDAYLDGLLAPAEADVVERAIAADPRLSAELNLHRLIEGSLRSQFEPPPQLSIQLPPPIASEAHSGAGTPAPAGPYPLPIERAAPSTPRRFKLSREFLAAAAVLVLTGAGLWLSGVLDTTPQGLISPESVYIRKVATGFNPEWVCTNDAEFEAVAREAFGQALQLPKDAGLEVVGWSYYEPVLSNDTFLLLTRIDGVEAIIIMDCRDRARRLSAPRSSGLSIHKRTFDNVVIYQASKKQTRNILPLFFNPDGKPVRTSCGGVAPRVPDAPTAPPATPGGN